MSNKARGFTLVELTIVIVVIGILATITVVAYNGTRQRAQATAIADGFKKIDEALELYASSENTPVWWSDEDYKDVNNESTIAYMIEFTSLKDYLNEVPTVEGFEDNFYTYDNDLDVYNGCASNSLGVNIQTPFTDIPVAHRIDDILDDGNLACGKVRMDTNGELVYSIDLDDER